MSAVAIASNQESQSGAEFIGLTIATRVRARVIATRSSRRLCGNGAFSLRSSKKNDLIVLSQKVAGSEPENQLFEMIQDWRARC